MSKELLKTNTINLSNFSNLFNTYLIYRKDGEIKDFTKYLIKYCNIDGTYEEVKEQLKLVLHSKDDKI